MSDNMTSDLELAEMIKCLRAELAKAAKEGVNEAIRFSVEDIELELDISIEKQKEGGLAAKFYVLTSQVKASKKDTVTQKLKIKLKAAGSGGKPLVIADDDRI